MRLVLLVLLIANTMIVRASAQRGTMSSVATVQLVAVRAGTVGLHTQAEQASVGLGTTVNGRATVVPTRVPVGVSWDVDPAQVGRMQVRYILHSPSPAPPQVVSHEIIAATPNAEGLDHFDAPRALPVHPLTVRLVVY